MGYKFFIVGSVAPSGDGRQAILLEPGERDLVLDEMRTFLQSVQAILQGVSEDNMESVAVAARKVGAAAQQAVPGSLMTKLPLAFKKLGFDTHGQFDRLGMDAEDIGDREHALEQLSVLMQNCVACHASYRIDAVAETRP